MPRKKKRNLIATLDHIERYHQRRSNFVIHIMFSLVFQAAMWINWYTSYAVDGVGFDNYFFTPRIGISTTLIILLAGHFALMRVRESKDRLVILALQQHQDELDDYDDETLIYEDADDSETAPMETEQPAAKLTR